MVDEKNTKPVMTKKYITAVIMAAAVAVSPFTIKKEGTIYKAYKDPVGIWTICNGHTKGVKAGDVATKEQCTKYLEEDMVEHMTKAVAYTPTLLENHNALKASGDFAFNAGAAAYGRSPMARHFKEREWDKGCKAFIGYYVGGTFRNKQKRYACKPKRDGKWLCTLPGLVTRRNEEYKICMGIPLK